MYKSLNSLVELPKSQLLSSCGTKLPESNTIAPVLDWIWATDAVVICPTLYCLVLEPKSYVLSEEGKIVPLISKSWVLLLIPVIETPLSKADTDNVAIFAVPETNKSLQALFPAPPKS